MGECPTDSPAGLRGKKPVYPGPSKDKFLPLRSQTPRILSPGS
jgi:hypothetical protein